ncbi:MAG: long-chain-acyl-CoA synthetase [Brevundimonas aurantiaca]|jgi:fatty-acyl-CoA synthase|nr:MULTISPECIES: long-chain-acyl-CoA synthetase [Brevundimonas]MBB1177850.1 long-chain-acyl-CoA synthetase [Pseudomonas sp. FW305-3-2-15-E-TSA4]MEC8534582.1 long-chain-acyl-CoA synthetase [Pseudomonadota bacterium]ALJ09611.1 long-chain acyl-CoA synthetase [Brevundimonas sp. DS20]MBA4787489.1 long-chain-acyl-CoA synthetase [Brevundimonas sp.]MBJ7510962.1 long-chain-acyl-CoA synthetase [Brevundimonas sp.]
MGLVANIRRDVRFARGLFRLLKRIKPIELDSDVLLCDDFEEAVDKFADNIAVEDERRSLTYRDLDAMANRFAHWAKSRGLRRSDTIALMMTNRVEYLAAWIGFSKVGVATALINTNLTGQGLAHCLTISNAFQVVADEDCWRQIEDARPLVGHNLMLWVLGLDDEDENSERRGLDKPVRGGSSVRPARSGREGLTNRDTALYIYTSGTTGLPKAARIPHSRARTYMRAFAGATRSTPKDRIFNVLPLYHSTGGLVGVGAALLNGARLVIRKKFSASSFWPDVVASGATMFVYIGELCRYLVNCPPQAYEKKHKLRFAFGNGMRGDVWPEFQSRFNIPEVLEFYGSTEGNVSLFNFDGKQGAIGRVPSYLKKQINIRLVQCDVETEQPVRGPDGLCRLARVGEIGEAIGEIGNDIRHDFSGYADKAASQKKILTDVFKKGDRWFRTGDLMRQDAEGYFYFVDRMGDTFRWKGENVSTSEVEQVLMDAPGVAEAIVYGIPVPGQEGKAGMAALVIEGKFDPKTFADHINGKLPAYAQPVFLRMIEAAETTGTFKYRKSDLVADGFDPEKVGASLYVRGGKSGYQKLTAAARTAILNGEGRL